MAPNDDERQQDSASAKRKTQRPCRVCTDFQSALHANSAPTSKPTTTPSQTLLECPPDGGKLGRHTWTMLHSVGAYYSDPKTQAPHVRSLLNSLSHVYPCGDCADHLREYIAKHPPELASRETLSKWLCEMHNEVNARLGKPTFDCTRVLERWLESSKCIDRDNN